MQNNHFEVKIKSVRYEGFIRFKFEFNKYDKYTLYYRNVDVNLLNLNNLCTFLVLGYIHKKFGVFANL